MIRLLLSILGLVLAASGALLLLEGTFHFGVVFSLGLGLLLLVAALAWGALSRWSAASAPRRWFWRGSWGLASVWGVSVLALFAMPIPHGLAAAVPTDTPRAVIVLGAGSARCEPSPVLQGRLDTAAEAARRWPSALIVLSGGRNHFHNVACTEAQVMQQALVAQGVDASRLVQEDRSANTTENLAYSARLLGERGITPDQPLAVVTSEFHGARALRLAEHQGFTHLAFVAAPTPIRYRYHLWLREYFASAWSWVSGEG
ncbi:YdcF family protein [Hydrogenophaga sp. RWCD_12]|uniref:YdcF family protein n=1 Tax=Hydrogenophaga sp. RWCD_12 TaxID=3391190 RepID=UPI003984C7DB